ncbi:hypothetical protein CEXT_606611 [Caerostris extrusa]|uniref:Uncharacterized protein n=1 Tax=Caerostris extrusa TaxID=172846 RepID=A0AAV4UZ22_CAEEX|nr:hypothetical protein CEXT_606611 [Caerostris extrusa]
MTFFSLPQLLELSEFDCNDFKCCKIYNYEKTRYAQLKGSEYVQHVLNKIAEKPRYSLFNLNNPYCGKYKLVVSKKKVIEVENPKAVLEGLQNLRRASPCYATEKFNRLVIYADLEASDLKLKYDGQAKIFGFYPIVSMYSSLSCINFIIEMSTDAESGKYSVLHNFKIKSIGEVRITIDGIRLFNWMVNAVNRLTTTFRKEFVRNWLEKQVKIYLTDEIPFTEFPILLSDDEEDEEMLNQ